MKLPVLTMILLCAFVSETSAVDVIQQILRVLQPTPTPTPTPTATPSGNKDLPFGIWLRENGDTIDPADPLLGEAWCDGIRVQFRWRDIQPSSPNVFNWSRVDAAVTLAKANGKLIAINIAAGKSRPNWLPALGATDFPFDQNNDGVAESTMPLPWEALYRQYWGAFVAAFGLRYDKEDTIAVVIITGEGQYGTEYHVVQTDVDIAAYRLVAQQAGFTDEHDALRQSSTWDVDQFHTAFPRTTLFFCRGNPFGNSGGGNDETFIMDYVKAKASNRGTMSEFAKATTTHSDTGTWPGYPKGDEPIGETADTHYEFYTDKVRPYDPDPTPMEDYIRTCADAGDQWTEIWPNDAHNSVNWTTFAAQRPKLLANLPP